MKNSWKIGILAVAVLALAGFVHGETFKVGTDSASPAFIIANNWTSSVTLATVGLGTQVIVTVDGNANTWGATSFTNCTSLATCIEKSTNAAGSAALIVNRNASLAADVAAGYLDTASYTLPVGCTTNAIYWDVSGALHYDCFAIADYQPLVIESVFGNPGGTGDLTLSIYVNQSLAWQTLLSSGQTFANSASGLVVSTGSAGLVPMQVGLPIEQGKNFFIRAARETTATTGNIGAVLKPWTE